MQGKERSVLSEAGRALPDPDLSRAFGSTLSPRHPQDPARASAASLGALGLGTARVLVAVPLLHA